MEERAACGKFEEKGLESRTRRKRRKKPLLMGDSGRWHEKVRAE